MKYIVKRGEIFEIKKNHYELISKLEGARNFKSAWNIYIYVRQGKKNINLVNNTPPPLPPSRPYLWWRWWWDVPRTRDSVRCRHWHRMRTSRGRCSSRYRHTRHPSTLANPAGPTTSRASSHIFPVSIFILALSLSSSLLEEYNKFGEEQREIWAIGIMCVLFSSFTTFLEMGDICPEHIGGSKTL